MKKIAVALCCVLVGLSANADTKTVRFAIGEWAPYTSSSNNPREKISERIVIRAYESQGYEVILSYYPWSRSLRLAKQGTYDGTFPWMFNSERKQSFYFSDAMFTQKVVFFSHGDASFSWKKLNDLKNFHIGATQDYQATNLLLNAGLKPTIENTEESNFEKLAKHRIDAYPTGLIRGKYLIDKYLSKEEARVIRIGDKPLVEDSMYIMFTQKDMQRSSTLSEVFSKGLKVLIESGEYQAIVFDSNRITSPDKKGVPQ
ncbi:substrate-binding periplasmic protein [Vibrio bivalvicida]|uniref:Amino acid ABC transporter n=1 Tax=Vibrio bivalvicida TaxID=1276888 RepID=A0A177XZK1_9VIBR|nr:transporter substrate-binding domain-containing protein [Vibrio bivalvicida]OAJ94033.1 amino acid ABC transporter [Vibrio bivalvicida]